MARRRSPGPGISSAQWSASSAERLTITGRKAGAPSLAACRARTSRTTSLFTAPVAPNVSLGHPPAEAEDGAEVETRIPRPRGSGDLPAQCLAVHLLDEPRVGVNDRLVVAEVERVAGEVVPVDPGRDPLSNHLSYLCTGSRSRVG